MNMDDYPEASCPKHLDRMWEWDGYVWICVDCVLQPTKIGENYGKAE